MLAAMMLGAFAHASPEIAFAQTSREIEISPLRRLQSSGAVCSVLNPILPSALGCSCTDAPSGVGGSSSCSYTTPSFTVTYLGQQVFNLPTVTIQLGAEVLPCGSPASAKIHGTVRLPSGLPPAITSELNTLAGDSGITFSGNTLSIEKGVEAGRSVSIKVPFYTASVASADLKLILTVSGNIDSLTVTQSVDLCLTKGGQEFCGANLPTCTSSDSYSGALKTAIDALCLATGNFDFKAALQNPPKQFMEITHNFANICPAGSGAGAAAAASGGMGGGAIFILIVLILIAVCAAAAAVWYFKKKPEERKATKEKFKAKMDAMKEKYKKKAATVAPDTEMETATE